jgi:hypothetical protein
MTRIWEDGEPITVNVDDVGLPALFIWNEVTHPVARVSDHWRVNTDWWSDAGEVDREYFRLTTKTGLLCEIYFDAPQQLWKLGRLYD